MANCEIIALMNRESNKLGMESLKIYGETLDNINIKEAGCKILDVDAYVFDLFLKVIDNFLSERKKLSAEESDDVKEIARLRGTVKYYIEECKDKLINTSMEDKKKILQQYIKKNKNYIKLNVQSIDQEKYSKDVLTDEDVKDIEKYLYTEI